MKVLVTGVKGQLGFDVCKHLTKRGIPNKGVDINDFDLSEQQATFAVITNYAPDVIVHCAAYTAVDKAEGNKEMCRKVNVDGTRHVALAAKHLDAKMVYISTDYVFDGKGDTPFEVDTPITPQNAYGLSKAQGEVEVQALLSKFFIVRISWAFGINGSNFIKTMMRLGSEQETLNVVSDQYGSPTYTDDLAALLCDMMETERYGIYHVTNEGYCSWYELATFIMNEAGLPCKVNAIETKDYPTPAKRPHNSRLSKTCLDENGFHRLPTWQNAVVRYIALVK